MPQQYHPGAAGLSGVLLTPDGKIYVRITAIDEDGVQRTILTTPEGKLITRITGVDSSGTQRTVLLTPDGKVIVRMTGLDEAGVQRTILTTPEGKIYIFGELDLVDSTIATIGADGSYASASFGLNGYHKIVGSCYANQPGTLYVEQSQDNTNWDVISSFPVNVDLTNPRGAGFQIDVLAPYGRVRYVNLATANTTFRLYTHMRVI